MYRKVLHLIAPRVGELECAATSIWTHRCFVRIEPVKSQKKNKTFILVSSPR